MIFSSAGSDHENPLLDDIKQRTVDRLADAKRRGLIPDYSRLKQEDGHTFIPLVPDPDFVPLAASREVYRWMPHFGGWVYRGVRRG